MRLFSTAAISLALAASAGLLMPATAMAQKSKKEEKAAEKAAKEAEAKAAEAAKLKLTDNYIKLIKPAQDALNANKLAEAKPLIDAAAPAISGVDDDYHYGRILLQYGQAAKDQAVFKAAFERLMKSERTPAGDRVLFAPLLGQIYLGERKYAEAQSLLEMALAGGAKNGSIYYQLAEAKFGTAITNSGGSSINEANKPLAAQGLLDLEKAVELPMADGTSAAPSLYLRGFTIARLASPGTALNWGRKLLKVAPTRDNWKDVLFLVSDLHKDLGRAESLDLYRLMVETNAFASPFDYDAYAEIAWKMGLPGEVIGLYTRGKDRGVVKDAETRELYKLAAAAVAKDKDSLVGSSASAAKAADGKSSSNTGNAYIGYDNYAKAVELFKQAQTKGGVDADELNTRLGIALARSGDMAGAQTAFGEVKGPGARREIADFWQLWLNTPKA